MANHIEVHALPYVAGEAVGSPGHRDRPAASAPRGRFAGQRGRGTGTREAKRAGYATAERGDTPVAVDAAHRADGEPETPADHRASPRDPAPVSSPRSTTRPGNVRLARAPRPTMPPCRPP